MTRRLFLMGGRGLLMFSIILSAFRCFPKLNKEQGELDQVKGELDQDQVFGPSQVMKVIPGKRQLIYGSSTP